MVTRAELLEEVLSKPDHRAAPQGYGDAAWEQLSTECLRRVVETIRGKRFPLFLYGGTGVGKTCIAALIYRRFRAQPMWLRADDLLLSLATGRTSREHMHVDSIDEDGHLVRKLVTFNQYQRMLASAPCVFLDDLGVRAPTDPMRQYLFDLLEYRKGKPLVITSNLAPHEGLSEMFDDRIISRICAGTVICISGEDRRAGAGKRFLVADRE